MQDQPSKLLHLEALGLDFNPFPVVPDAHNYFKTEKMHIAISDILHCIEARKGFILISGEVGLGKTTLSRLLLQKLAVENVSTALVLNTFLQSGSLLKAINKDFNIYIDSDAIEDQLDALNDFLLNQYAQNKNCVIVIDDAQQLSLESLELVRQLSNLETNQDKLLQIILVAQGEILTTLNRNDMRQLKSRIVLNIKIEPLSLLELKQYVEFRLARAGSSGHIFLDKNAYKLLHKFTQGLPRQINLIMDRCLYVVAAFGNNKINKALIKKAFEEISIVNSTKTKSSTNMKILSIAAILLIILSLPVYIYKDQLFSKIFTPNQQLNASISNTNTLLADKQSTHDTSAVITPTHGSPQDSAQNNLNPTQYLAQFDLNFLQTAFEDSLNNNDFTNLKNQLHQQSEFKLLIGYNIFQSPNSTNQNMHIWEIQDSQNKAKWLTFWKPKFTINSFYLGYYSESISKLQDSLKEEGFYQADVDGFVGEKTVIAIAKFQNLHGYNPSGFPDELTLYKLQDLMEHKVNSSETKDIDYYRIKENDKKPQQTGEPTNRYAVDNSIITD